jgi:hypothetical protein
MFVRSSSREVDVAIRVRLKIVPSPSAAATMIFVPPMSNPMSTAIAEPLDVASPKKF